jgi:D-alanyl-D-alanine dipeptidase
MALLRTVIKFPARLSFPLFIAMAFLSLPLLIALTLLPKALADEAKPRDSSAKVAGHEFVDLARFIPDIIVELPYATENNFFKHRFYASNRCLLRKSVAERLALVQRDLREQGLGLKIWDGYRPHSVQWAFWKVMPDERYVADPKKGSRHNRGAAVDCTVVNFKTKQELVMPTAYDDFSEKAAADYAKLPAEALHNRAILTTAMSKHGFTPLPTEWWHFDAPGWKAFPLENFDPWSD